MIDRTDFEKKQFIFYFPSAGDKMTFQNDNIVIKDKDKKNKIPGYLLSHFYCFHCWRYNNHNRSVKQGK